MAFREGAPGGAEMLEAERDRLQNAVAHLESSNAQLRAANAQEADPVFREAIGENVVTIAKYRASIAAISQEIQKLRRGLDSSAPRLSACEAPSGPREEGPGGGRAGEPHDTEMADTSGEQPGVDHGGVWL